MSRRDDGKQLPTPVKRVRMSYTSTKLGFKDNGELKLRQAQFSRGRQDSTQPYSYTPLTWPSSRIRLLEILPGADTHVYCRIHTANLDSIGFLRIDEKYRKYEALSYTWHGQALTKTIICDERLLQVTHNIHDALHALRRSSTSRLLWIDAICINQADLQERSHQVSIMRQIYSRAALVISWLGKEDEHSATAFHFIEKFIKKHVSAGISLHASPDAIWSKQTMDAMNLPHFPSYEWEALARLFERPYFRRIWVVQELVVSAKTIVRCGSLTIKWEYIEYIARSLLATGWLGALNKLTARK